MKKIHYFPLMTLVLALSHSLLAAPGQGSEKAGKGADKAHKMASKHDKGGKSDHRSAEATTAALAVSSAGVALTLTSGGISVSQARELALSHQLTGYQSLPPGIRKQLARGKPLPPGIARKQLQPAFVAQLPQHTGYEWQVCGTDLVLVAIATQVIADVITDVFL